MLEVECVFVKIGIVDVVIDVVLLSVVDNFIILKFCELWFDFDKIKV